MEMANTKSKMERVDLRGYTRVSDGKLDGGGSREQSMYI